MSPVVSTAYSSESLVRYATLVCTSTDLAPRVALNSLSWFSWARAGVFRPTSSRHAATAETCKRLFILHSPIEASTGPADPCGVCVASRRAAPAPLHGMPARPACPSHPSLRRGPRRGATRLPPALVSWAPRLPWSHGQAPRLSRRRRAGHGLLVGRLARWHQRRGRRLLPRARPKKG